jgi:hypothetical protein
VIPSCTHPLQLEHVPRHARHVGPLGRRIGDRRRAISTEGPRDLVETVDLRQHARRVLLEHAVEVHAPVAPRATEVLHAEPDGRQRVLDLVRHLASHLAPREHALGARHLGHVVHGDDRPPRTRREPRDAHLQATPHPLHLEVGLLVRGVQEGEQPRVDLGPQARSERDAGRERGPEDRLGARIRERDAALGRPPRPRRSRRSGASPPGAVRRSRGPRGSRPGRSSWCGTR